MGFRPLAVLGGHTPCTIRIGDTTLVHSHLGSSLTLIACCPPCRCFRAKTRKQRILGTVYDHHREWRTTLEFCEICLGEARGTRSDRRGDIFSAIHNCESEGNGSAIRVPCQVNACPI